TNPTWKDTIRRVVRQYAIFQPLPPNRSGLYRLVEQPSVDAEPESLRDKSPVDHSTAQGMLLTLGRMYGYETFAPATDRTSRSFQGKPLADFSTVTDCAELCGRFRERMLFRDYCELDTLYNSAVKHEENSKAFGVSHR